MSNEIVDMLAIHFANYVRSRVTATDVIKSVPSEGWTDDDTIALKHFITEFIEEHNDTPGPIDCFKWAMETRGRNFPHTEEFVNEIVAYISSHEKK
jgi:hypothetical protein